MKYKLIRKWRVDMNNLQVIDQREVLGFDFKVYGDIENPLVLAKDVAEWIDNKNVSQMLNVIDEGEKALYTMYRLDGSSHKQWFLTEDGLYEVLMLSRKPIAKEFKKQVKLILKQIRKTGGMVVDNREEEFINNYFPSFSDDVKLAMVQDLRKKNQEYKKQLEVQKPKVDVFDMFVEKEHTLGFRELKKEVESALDITIKEPQLKEMLRDLKIIGKTIKGSAYAIRNGFAVTKDIIDFNGRTRTQDRFTMKCRDELVKYIHKYPHMI